MKRLTVLIGDEKIELNSLEVITNDNEQRCFCTLPKEYRYLLKRGDNINIYEEGTITEILNGVIADVKVYEFYNGYKDIEDDEVNILIYDIKRCGYKVTNKHINDLFHKISLKNNKVYDPYREKEEHIPKDNGIDNDKEYRLLKLKEYVIMGMFLKDKRKSNIYKAICMIMVYVYNILNIYNIDREYISEAPI